MSRSEFWKQGIEGGGESGKGELNAPGELPKQNFPHGVLQFRESENCKCEKDSHQSAEA